MKTLNLCFLLFPVVLGTGLKDLKKCFQLAEQKVRHLDESRQGIFAKLGEAKEQLIGDNEDDRRLHKSCAKLLKAE